MKAVLQSCCGVMLLQASVIDVRDVWWLWLWI